MSHQDEAKRGHRAQRIERVSAEILEFELLPSLENPLLNDLHVLRVEATRNLAALHVVIVPGPAQSSGVTAPPEEVQAALQSAQDYLRLELASAIRIKRVPLLRLTYLPLPLHGTAAVENETGGGA